MILEDAKVFLNGHFVKKRIRFDSRFHEAASASPDEPVLHAKACLAIPGLIDLHTHAAVGADASDGSPEGLAVLSRYYARNGVTSWCPTTMTYDEPVLTTAMKTIRDFVRPSDGAKAVGIHLEGPFISASKCGAQNPAYITAPDIRLFHRLNEASGGRIRLITLAPEAPGAIPFIREASRICTVSLGHTEADYATAMAAFQAGASHLTHLFCAMTPSHHRSPGVIGAGFDAGATSELITDGLHVHPSFIRMAYRLFGERLIMISDSLRCAGMPDGEYELSGQSITMQGGRAVLTGTNTLAGSSISLLEGLRRAVSFGIPIEDAVLSATLAPAKVIGMDSEIGSIAPGKRADLVLLDEELQVKAVFVEGRQLE